MRRRIGSVILGLHGIGNIVEKEPDQAADDDRKQKKTAEQETKPREKPDGRIDPAIFKARYIVERHRHAEPDKDIYNNGQAKRLQEHGAEGGVTELRDGPVNRRNQMSILACQTSIVETCRYFTRGLQHF